MTISLRFFLSKRRIKLKSFCLANNVKSYQSLVDILKAQGVDPPTKDEYEHAVKDLEKYKKKPAAKKQEHKNIEDNKEPTKKPTRRKRRRQPARKKSKSSKVVKE
jgi:hypothetical protein